MKREGLWQGGGAAPSRIDLLSHRIVCDFYWFIVREGQGEDCHGKWKKLLAF